MSEHGAVGLPDVEVRLADLAAHLDWPELPDSVAATRNRLVAGERGRGSRTWARPLALLAGAIVLAVAVLLVIPGTRGALADLFGLGGVTIREVPTTVATTAGTTIAPPLDLGRAVTLDEAAALAPFELLTPSTLGAPDQVFTDEVDGRLVVTLLYPPAAALPRAAETDVGLLVTEFGGSIDPLIEKQVGAGQAERLVIDAQPAIWVQGQHTLIYVDPGGDVVTSESRLAASTMVVSRAGTTVRLEGAFDRATAVGLVQSLEPVPG